MKTPFKLLLISAEQDIPNEAETINKLFSQGLKTFHLRKPGWDIEQTQRFLAAISNEYHLKIVLHTHFQLTNKFNLKGVHLNEEGKKKIALFAQFNIISASFHSLQDLKKNTYAYQYTFLSPVFNSISKPGYNTKFELKSLAGELNAIKLKNPLLPEVIPLGGISTENIMQIKDVGFSGAALLGAVWQSASPVETFLTIKSIAEAR